MKWSTVFRLIFTIFVQLVWISFKKTAQSSISPLSKPGIYSITTELCTQHLSDKSAYCSSLNLTRVPNNLGNDLRILSLYDNAISALSNFSFTRYPLLIELDLSRNKLRSIDPLALFSLQYLRKLELSSNELKGLSNGIVFKGLSELSYLDISNCHLNAIPYNLFRYLPKLKKAIFSSNDINSVNITSCKSRLLQAILLDRNSMYQLIPETFVFTCTYKYLSLSGNRFQTVDPNTVASLSVRTLYMSRQILADETWESLFMGISRSSISELYITRKALNNIPEGFFEPLHNHLLSRLDLSGNTITVLDRLSFANLTRVVDFVLLLNRIKFVEPEHFAEMKYLRSLNLNNNKIISINIQQSRWRLNIHTLLLSGNLLTELDPYAFYGLENVSYINLMDNFYLSVLNITSLSGLTNLKRIRLTYCNLNKLSLYNPLLKSFSISTGYHYFGDGPFTDRNIFQNTKELEEILIRGSLETSDLESSRGGFLFTGLTSLRFLFLSNNDFHWTLPDGIFRGLLSLEELYMNSTRISFIEKKLFAGLISLRLLDLRHNEIKDLPMLNDIYSIQYLLLDNNRLKHLNDTVFLNSTMLTFLSLSNNFFVDFIPSTFDPLNLSLLSIDISGNPVMCNCEQMWLLAFLKDVNTINAKEIICSPATGTLQPLKNHPLFEVEFSELCKLHVAVYTAVPLAILTLSSIMITVYYFRWYLKNKLFLLKLAILGYDEMQDGRDPQDFEFDLNVVYADNDEVWIQDHLKGALMDQMPEYNRNAIGDESLNLGMYYLDAVNHVMERSYKIILILSRAAVQNNLFLTKFRMAQDLVSDLQLEKMFVIFLEDIPDDEMPFVVRLYLSSRRPYLNWTDDARGQQYFWDQFETLLKVNKIYDPIIPAE